MFGKLFCIIISIFFVSLNSCARPKYERLTDEFHDRNHKTISNEEKISDCDFYFNISKYCLKWEWDSKPTHDQVGSIIFKVYRSNLYDETLVLVDLDSIPNLVLWMPSMGHGSSPTSTTRLDLGTYKSDNVFFVMSGEWELKFQAKNGNQVIDEALVNIIF